MSTTLLILLKILVIGAVYSQKYAGVECDFEANECQWNQRDHDLTNWTRVTDEGQSYMSVTVDNGTSTLARMYSGNFSFPDSPSISIRYFIKDNITNGERTNIKFYVLGREEQLRLLAIAYSDDTDHDDWENFYFTVTRGDPGEPLSSVLIIEADIKADGDEVAVDDIKVFGCRITSGSPNTAEDQDEKSISCLSVPESSKIGQSVCTFAASGVESSTFGGELKEYNNMEISNSNTVLDFIMTNSYTPIVDTATPNVVPEGIISCIDSTYGLTVNYTLIIKIFEENNHPPTFTLPSYTFSNVPEGMEIGEDFAIEPYGTPIDATDLDNCELGLDSTNIIVYELEEDFGTFSINSTLLNTTYPVMYRASIHLLKPLDYANQSSYNLTVLAKNDNNSVQTASAAVVINIADPNNLNPNIEFSADYYTATISTEMLQHAGIYTVPTSPPVKIKHSPDPITFDITYNCGDSKDCEILAKKMRIGPSSGEIFFINNIGEIDRRIPQITFEITATRLHNQHSKARASLKSFFE